MLVRFARGKLSKKSDTARAVRYALGRWEALLRFCDDGRIEIDNNAAERSLRTVVLGRKTYLFCRSDAGGERAAAIYSLVATAKLNNLNPEAICGTSCLASRSIRSTASKIRCHGTSQRSSLETQAALHSHHRAVICFAVDTNSTSREPSAVRVVTYRRVRPPHKAWLQPAILQRGHQEQQLW